MDIINLGLTAFNGVEIFCSHKDFSKYSKKKWRNEIVGEAELAEKYGCV